MMYEGHILLDPDNRPIRNFREIPLAISSKLEGWVIEAIRRQHSQIAANDFRARMPRDPSGQSARDVNGTWTGTGKDPLCTSGSIDMKMTRWRMRHRCASWVEKAGSRLLRDYFWEQMTPENQAVNTTEWMTDVTDKNEIKLIESLNEGMYPKRSKKRKAEQLEESQEKALEPEEDLGLEEAATADEQSAKRLQVQHIGGQGQAEEATTAMKNSK